VSGQGFEGVSVADARHQFALSLQDEATNGGSGAALESALALSSQARASSAGPNDEAPSRVSDHVVPSSTSPHDTAHVNRLQDNHAPDDGGGGREEGEGLLGNTVGLRDLKLAKRNIEGLMTFQQFLHAVGSLVAKGGKVASSLVKSRMGGSVNDQLRSSPRQADETAPLEVGGHRSAVKGHGEGDSEGIEGVERENGPGHVRVDDLHIPQRGRRHTHPTVPGGYPTLYRSEMEHYADSNVQDEPLAKENVGRVPGQPRRRLPSRPTSAMGRVGQSDHIRHDRHPDQAMSAYFTTEDADFLRSVARDEALLLIRSAEIQVLFRPLHRVTHRIHNFSTHVLLPSPDSVQAL
jgi:hypothetical protein